MNHTTRSASLISRASSAPRLARPSSPEISRQPSRVRERSSHRTGFLATLSALLRVGGTSAPAGFRAPARRRRAGQVPAVLCGLLLAFAALLALAATSASAAEPTLTVNPVAAHTITTANLTGTLTFDTEANGGAEGLWTFQYCEDAAPGECTQSSPWSYGPAPYTNPALPAGTTAEPVQEVLSGLKAATEYSVRLAAYPFNTGVEVFSPEGNYQTFTTDPAPQAPALVLQPATPSYLSAHIQGTLDPEGGNLNGPGEPVPIHWAIELSESGEPETFFPAAEGDITGPEAEESNPLTLQADPALTQNATYHYRLRATYAGQQQLTSDATFTTLEVARPKVTIKAASEVSYQSAQANGTVDPGGADPAFNSPCHFDYTTQTSFEEKEFAGAAQAPCEPETVAGPGAQPVTAKLSGLAPATTYRLRLVAENPGGQSVSTVPNPSFTTLPVAAPTVSIATPTPTATTAHFSAQVNPNAPGPEPQDPAFNVAWHFECSPECPGLAGGEVLADNANHEVQADATGLTPGTSYTVTLIASNAAGPTAAGPEPFTTAPLAPTIDSTSAANVTSTSADLRAQINPNGADVSTAPPGDCHFEYGTDPTFATATASLPCTPPDLGQGVLDVPASVHLQGLQPDTAYHYRVVAGNGIGAAQTGPGRTFTTASQSPLGSALPDDRAYEMVSPVDKNGGDIRYASTRLDTNGGVSGGGVPEAAADGSAVTYLSFLPFSAPQAALAGSQYLSRRGLGAWSTQNISAPVASGVYALVGRGTPYKIFAEDLSASLFDGAGQTYPGTDPLFFHESLFGLPLDYEFYLRDNLDGAFRATVTTENATPDPSQVEGAALIKLQGATPDLRNVLISFGAAYTPHATPVGTNNAQNLYEWSRSGGGLQVINILPGETESTPASGGNFLNHLSNRHAVSADGSRVFWFDEDSNSLYLRDTNPLSSGDPAAQTTVLVAERPGRGLRFQAASTDGSIAFYTDQSGTGDLYRYDVDTAQTVDLTPNGDIEGVLGASADGSSLYFAAADLAPGATQGQPNLYLWRDDGTPAGATTFITTLSQSEIDQNNWRPEDSLARVSPDGRHLAFVSVAGLTGYDNTRSAGGICQNVPGPAAFRCPEVFLYDAQAKGGAGALTCASCNPSGAQPLGPSFIPGPTLSDVTIAFYIPRVLSDDGSRLFFNSQDALLPRDVNGKQDVYEWEAPGSGSCEESSSAYSPSNGGCIYLLSGGLSNRSSTFIDAGTSGRDVFFITSSPLLPQDVDTSFDLYDARAGGGYPPPPPAPPACLGDACQQPAVPPIHPTPGTALLNGPGNVVECPKGKFKKSGKCVKHHPKKHHKKHRANSNRRASR